MSSRMLLRMSADAFLAWASDQPDGQRYDLAAGEVVAMAPDRAAHTLVKLAVAQVLGDAARRGGLLCQVFPDGMAVWIDDATVYEPDASVRCGPRLADDAIEYADPVIVVEVLSPSMRARDADAKLHDYFRLQPVRHYLILCIDMSSAIHHARSNGRRHRHVDPHRGRPNVRAARGYHRARRCVRGLLTGTGRDELTGSGAFDIM